MSVCVPNCGERIGAKLTDGIIDQRKNAEKNIPLFLPHHRDFLPKKQTLAVITADYCDLGLISFLNGVLFMYCILSILQREYLWCT